MNAALLTVIALAALVLIAIAVLALLALRRALPGPSADGETVVIHTKDERSVRGVVHGEYSDRIDLIQAEYLASANSTTAMGGIVEVPRSNIRMVQRLPAGE